MSNKYHVDLTPDLIKKAQSKIDHIFKNGSIQPGVSEKFDSTIKPDFYDANRFKKAQKIIQDNFAQVGNSTIIGLVLNFQTPYNLITLLSTGQSKCASILFNRNINTMAHLDSWYNSDLFDKKSKAYKSHQLVQQMHKNVHKLMNDKTKNISVYEFVKKMIDEKGENSEEVDIEKLIRNKDRIWVSQADMILINWSFLGPLILDPYACGVHGSSKKQLTEILYLWKVINHRMGIEEQFSLVGELDFDMVYTVCKLIFEQEILPFVENASSSIGIKMGQATLLGFERIVPYIRCSSFLNYWYKKFNINAYKLNRANLDNDRFEFPNKLPIKTELSKEDRELMLKNGYSDKPYIVSYPELPFEEIEIKEEDKPFYKMYEYNMNTLFKRKLLLKLIRIFNKRKMNKLTNNKKEHMDILKEAYDDKMNFPACPFTNITLETDYQDFSDLN